MPIEVVRGPIVMTARSKKAVSVPLKTVTSLLQRHRQSDPLTAILESFSRRFVERELPQQNAYLFVRSVCAWVGLRGKNLEFIYTEHATDNFKRLRDMLQCARDHSMRGDPARGIQSFEGLKGPRVSFRSKFLRFLCPDHAAVLDLRFQQRADFKDTHIDYGRFVESCRKIRCHLNERKIPTNASATWRTTDVEAAMFVAIKDDES